MMIAPVRKSTPTKALEIINNLQPLDIFLHSQGVLAYSRHKKEYALNWTGSNPKYPKLTGHRLFWLNLSYKAIKGQTRDDSIIGMYTGKPELPYSN